MITNRWLMGNGDDISEALELRREVFVEEQGYDPAQDEDVMDAQAMHLMLYDGMVPVGTGRVYHDGKTFRIGRLCIRKQHRGQGMGDLLVKLLLLKAFEFNPSVVRISAQEYAVGFYERYGFAVEEGGEHLDEGQPHIYMAVTRETLLIPSKCGNVKRFDDFFVMSDNG